MSTFSVVTMPFAHFLEMAIDPEMDAPPTIEDVQEAIADHTGEPASWDEASHADHESDAWELEAHCLFALKAAGAWHALHGTLEGFEVGEDPLDHPIWEQIAEREPDEIMPQLVSSHAWDAAYVPVAIDGLVETTWNTPEDEDGYVLLVGSLPALAAELELLAGPLGLEGLEEPAEDAVFDEEADPLAAVKYAFYVLGSEVRRAIEIGLPLFVVYDGEEDDEDGEGHDHEGHDHAGHDHGDLN
ncbi:MAG: hypothetical protein R3F39_13005 [Myxococcota bacterium]